MGMEAIWGGFAGAAGPAVVSALWQGAALAMGLALSLRLMPRIAATDRFRIWMAGFATLAVLPFLPGAISLFHSLYFAADAAFPGVSTSSVQALPAHPWLDLDPRWSLAIAAAWLAAALARAVDLGVHTLRLRRLWKRAAPIHSSASEALLGLKVEICATRDLDRPSVIGFFAPRILIPEWLLERLTASELEQVLLHEAEHLRRRDDWINLAQKLCLVLFPLNPALAWMERRLCREREMACDEGVVRRTQAPRAYAACLASLAERGLQHRAEALSLGAWQRRPELVDRVHRILRRNPGLHPVAARALLGLVGCSLVLGAVELARCPQLVAFAARPAGPGLMAMNADAMTNASPANVSSMRGFRAINAVARVPSRAELAAARLAQRQTAMRKDRARWSPTLATEKTRQDGARSILVAAPSDSGQANSGGVNSHEANSGAEVAVKEAEAPSAAAQPQQWIVFTAWEQVDSVANPGADQAASAASPAGQNHAYTAYSYTMTRLILRVYPVSRAAANSNATQTGATKATAVKAGPASTSIPISPLPAAIPIRNGWLVIQL